MVASDSKSSPKRNKQGAKDKF